MIGLSKSSRLDLDIILYFWNLDMLKKWCYNDKIYTIKVEFKINLLIINDIINDITCIIQISTYFHFYEFVAFQFG